MLDQAGLTAQEATIELIISKMANIDAIHSALLVQLLMIVKSSTTKLMKKTVTKDSLITRKYKELTQQKPATDCCTAQD